MPLLASTNCRFQPTLPVRGATPPVMVWEVLLAIFQPTLPVRGATPMFVAQHIQEMISTHAPRAGSDNRWFSCITTIWYFNPRSPCGERLYDSYPVSDTQPISTHAPRAGSDESIATGEFTLSDFNPRSPCGERHTVAVNALAGNIFQPTLPVRGATVAAQNEVHIVVFQPTLPVRGATFSLYLRGRDITVFQPTLPVRGATFSACAIS